MSIGKIEHDIQRMKKEFSEISPGSTTQAEPVQKKKGSHSIIIWAAVVVIIIAVVLLVIFFL
jgi:hypothetical protein